MSVPPVITVEQAIAEGIGEAELRNCSDWHRAAAHLSSGVNKERHFHLAAKLTMVADKLR